MKLSIPYIVLDLETTGLNSEHDRILEFAGYRFAADDHQINDFITLIDPETDVGPTHIHHITNEMIREENAKPFYTMAASIAKFLNGYVYVIHNASFDLRFLIRLFAEVGYEFDPGRGICTYLASGCLSLEDACQKYNIENALPHAAGFDAYATGKLLRNLEGEPGTLIPMRVFKKQ